MWRVGQELRSRVLVSGRLTRSKIAAACTRSGRWIWLVVGSAFSLFSGQNQLGFLVTTPLLGAAFGLAWSQIGCSTATRHGNRDFASISQVVATKCEVLVEHQQAASARELLATMPREVVI